MKSNTKIDVIRAAIIGRWGEIARSKPQSSQLELIERALTVIDQNDPATIAYIVEKSWGLLMIDVYEAIAAAIAME